MTSPQFTHLRLHSEYSITDSIVRIRDAVGSAVEDNMPALALTDLMNLFGVVKFYSTARAAGVKPICGVDCWIANPKEPEQPYRLLLLVRNYIGYRQLCQLLTRAYLSENRGTHGRAEIHLEWLETIFSEQKNGLIALSGAQASDVGQAILAGDYAEASKRALVWAKLFPDAYYLEVQRYDQPQAERIVSTTARLANELKLPLVATHPIQFRESEDFQAHEVRVCIAKGCTLGDNRRARDFTTSQYFKSQEQMLELFSDLPEAIENTMEIAQRCNLELTLGENFLPDFPTPDGVTINDFLAEKAKQGLKERLIECFDDLQEREAKQKIYEERLDIECKTISKMGFPGYFLIVADFINWAKNADPPIPVGPGRGSGAGSLVAFCLKITDVDPIPYALLFERFLNPERVDMPDFDIDFCQEARGRVIEYVRTRYGGEAVCQIVTFGTMASKAAIRDVGRVLDLPYFLCDKLSKLIPVVQNKPLSLREAIAQEPALQELMHSGQDAASIQTLFQLAEKLEDLTRNVGMHAGGVLIAQGSISDYCPLYKAADSAAVPVSQFDKDDVEKIGLVKFDFLGLRNLTIIQRTLQYIEQLSNEKLTLSHANLDDLAVYKMLCEANTIAVFQLESEGMKQLLKKLRPSRFEDIVAVLALFRPGPLGSGMIDDFVQRKNGRQHINYFHPDLKECLESTYGIIVYQEQVMQISQIIGGYTLGAADLLRRAMGKKKPEEMAKHRRTITVGAQKNGYSPQLAEQLFDLMTKFAEYGFNKSHSAAYAIITYQTAWLKVHHTAAFMAASLSSDMDSTNVVKLFYDDAEVNGIRILPPDINTSDYNFIPIDIHSIRYGLGAIKGVGEQAISSIRAAREKKEPFADLFDFCRRVDRRQANRRCIDALICAGAFDQLPGEDMHSRAKLAASLDIAMEAAEQAERHALQIGLFDEDATAQQPLQYTEVTSWNDRERLLKEKSPIGFFLSGHPYAVYRTELSCLITHSLKAVHSESGEVRISGIITNMRNQTTRRGKMAMITLDDGSALLEVSVFSEIYTAEAEKLEEDALLIVEGKASFDEYTQRQRISAARLLTLNEARRDFATKLDLKLDFGHGNTAADAKRLKESLEPYFTNNKAGIPVYIHYGNQAAKCELTLGEEQKIHPDEVLLQELRAWLGPEAVNVQYN